MIVMELKRLLLFSIATVLGLTLFAQNQQTGEIVPSTNGVPAQDHFFVRGDYDDTGILATYDNVVSFKSGNLQLVWIYLDDDAIYENEAVQALTPSEYQAGKPYNEITYNSFETHLYLPEDIEMVGYEDDDGNVFDWEKGDRMPSTAQFAFGKIGTITIDGLTYNAYNLVCFNMSAYCTHFSSKTAKKYESHGALKKDYILFGIYLQNNMDEAKGRLDQDMIFGQTIMGLKETEDLYFYGTGGNGLTYRNMLFHRVELYGSKGISDNASGDDCFTIPDTATMHGNTIEIPISMHNVETITAFQTDIYLPNGFEFVSDDGDFQVSLSDRKARDHIIMANLNPDGSLRVLSYSPGLKPFSGNDGDLFYVTIRVPENGDGDYQVSLRNSLLTTTNEEEIALNLAIGTITVYPYILGDANDSGAITVSDVVATVRYILNYNPYPFLFGAADVNRDNSITVTDVVKIARLVLEAGSNQTSVVNPAKERMHGMISEITDNVSYRVTISLDDSKSYTAYQLNIKLPEGVVASNFASLDNSLGHLFDINSIDDNTIRVLCYNNELNSISSDNGMLFTFDVVSTGDAQDAILVDDIELVTTDGETVNLDNFNISFSSIVSLNELETALRISVEGRNIIVESPEDHGICICDITGRSYTKRITAGRNVIPVSDAGVYIVRSGNKATKVFIQ